MAPEKVVPYFGTLEKPECHILYNVTTMASTWHTVATKDVSLLRNSWIFGISSKRADLPELICVAHDDIGWGLDYDFLKNFSIDEVSHKKFLNDFFTGKYPDTFGRGELYNDDPRLGDARLCGTTASLCGIEKYGFEGNVAGVDRSVRYDITLHAFMLSQSGIPVIYSGDEIGQVNDYSYKDDPDKAVDSRYLHRGEFNWSLAPNRNIADTVQGKLFHAWIIWNISEVHTAFLIQQPIFVQSIPGILLSLQSYAKMQRRNSSESITSAIRIRLHGSTKMTAYTLILSQDMRWKLKVL